MDENLDQLAMDAAMKRFNDGEPLPMIDPADQRIVWEAWQERMPKSPGRGAYALGAKYLISCGFNRESLHGETMVAVKLRQLLLMSLVERGVLDRYRDGSSFRDEVFRVAATMPCGAKDVAEAAAARRLLSLPPDAAFRLRDDLAKEGLDPHHPHVDEFLSWMTEQIQKSE